MSFDDLPPDWPSRPLTEQHLVADVLDLFVDGPTRRDGGLCLLLCDEADRLAMPIVVGEVHDAGDQPERARLLTGFFRTLAEDSPGFSVLAALARPGGLSVTADDVCWAEAIAQAAHGSLRLLGVHVVTPDGSRPVPRTARAA